MLSIGIVAEGKSDHIVLKAIVRQLVGPNLEFTEITPESSALAPGGLDVVRGWCEEFGSRLETFQTFITSLPLDLLIIHIDGSMAHRFGIAQPCPPAHDTANAVREIIVTQWLARRSLPPLVVLAIPMQEIETWLLPAHVRAPELPVALECMRNPKTFLNQTVPLHGRQKTTTPQRYERLAAAISAQLAQVRSACPQADRFCRELMSAVAAAQSPP